MALENDIKNMLESMDLSLYDTVITNEFDETIFRVNITKAGGISMETCVEVTKLLSPLLDVTSPVKGNYRLEVSSPGIERALKTLDHFVNSVGEKVSLTTSDKEKLRGVLTKVDGNTLSLEVDGECKNIDYMDVKKARTYFEW